MRSLSLALAFTLVGCTDNTKAPPADLGMTAVYSAAPLQPGSPWPKFRANLKQDGRSAIHPHASDAQPWAFATGKGIFSNPVVDKNGTVFVGSADRYFYALGADGSLNWKVLTGEVIDS